MFFTLQNYYRTRNSREVALNMAPSNDYYSDTAKPACQVKALYISLKRIRNEIKNYLCGN